MARIRFKILKNMREVALTVASATEFDYVVVGAGSAGCVIAARLSQDRDVRVLLLEAGSGREPLEAVAVPPAWPALLGSSADWADETVPQGPNGLTVPWPRGRGLGGIVVDQCDELPARAPLELRRLERGRR